MLQKFQNPTRVPFGQRDSLVARHDLLSRRQRSTHDETGEIQPLVSGGGHEKTLLFARRAQFDSIIARS